MLDRVRSLLLFCRHACRRLCSCLQVSPLIFCLVATAVLIVVSLILIFNVCLARIFTVPGAFILNLGFCWLLLRLVVRAIVFPGSIVLWKRNTEASYRVEMAKQFAHHLEHLHGFLELATSRSCASSANATVESRSCASSASATMEGAMLGCMVVEGLARNFRVQQRDQVRFTTEQAHFRHLVQGVESWLTEAKVCEGKGKFESQIPLTDWMQRMSQSLVPVPLNYAVSTSPLVKEAEANAITCIDRLEQLMTILNGLQQQQDGFCANAQRFLRVPTVGSLHQLRAELQLRYSGHHYWVRTTSGRKIDAMFISCQASEGDLGHDDGQPTDLVGSSSKEDVPLKECSNSHPVIVWCNPNAAYYETMAYESHWLDFYLLQGCNVFLFNYSGFGRSQGHPTPNALASDGNAVIEFLRRRGFTQVGVHGRSIGGITACSLARAHPDVVKFLVADRTFSTLAKAAKYTFGNWAAKGLSLSATWADNFENYFKARCYKVMICDPKDATIPDLASLRAAVAMGSLEQVPPSDRFIFDEDKIERLVTAWAFFDTLISICERDDHQCATCHSSIISESRRPARQPVVGKPAAESDIRIDVSEEDTARLVASRPRSEPRKCVVNAQWLEEQKDIVRSVMGSHVALIRLTLFVAGTQFNASGMTLDDALSRSHDEACDALRCFLANIQVWGSLGSLREPVCPGIDKDIEQFLQNGLEPDESPEMAIRLAKVATTLTPDRLSVYHRQLSRSLVAQGRREFRQYLSTIRRALESPARDDGLPSAQLCTTALSHLREIESFMTAIYRFFKCVDIAGSSSAGSHAATDGGTPKDGTGASSDAAASDDSEEGREPNTPRPLRPAIDRSITGYVMCIDCGHNGTLREGEVQHLALHLQAAGFGKHSADNGNDRNIP